MKTHPQEFSVRCVADSGDDIAEECNAAHISVAQRKWDRRNIAVHRDQLLDRG